MPGHDGGLLKNPRRRLRLEPVRQPRAIQEMRLCRVPVPLGAGSVVLGGVRWDRQLALHGHRLNPFDFTCEKQSHRSRLTLLAILALY
jgi:hypothetical protein